MLILLFNSFNIYSSLTVSIQFHDSTDIVSLVVSILAGLLLPLFTIIFIKYNSHFLEFRNEFDETSAVCKLSKEATIKIRRKYPILMICEFVLAPLILSIEVFEKYGLFVIAGLEIIIIILVSVFPLYSSKLDNARNYVHRVIVLAIVGLQAATKYLMP